MELIQSFFIIISGLSFLLNTILAFKLRQLHTSAEEAHLEIQKLRTDNAKKKEVLSIEAQQILHDMTAHGSAVLRIIPLNPSEIFYRSPS